MKIVGIDIGSYKIKIAEIVPGSNGGDVTHYEEHQLSQGPNKDKQIEILDLLREYEKTQDLDGVHYVVGVNPFQITHRNLKFPFKERHSILKTLPIELEDDIPFSPENAVFEAKILKYTGEGTQVLSSACPNSVIDATLEEMQNCNIEPNILSAQTLAFSNLFENWSALPQEDKEDLPSPKPLEVILNIGHKGTFALFYQDNLLMDIRSFHWGGETLVKAISVEYKSTLPEAYSNLRGNSFLLLQEEEATEEQIKYSNFLKSEIDKFTHDLLLTLLEIKSLHQTDVGKIYTNGPVTRIKNFNAYMTQKLEVAISPLAFNPKGINLATNKLDMASGAVAVGLAMEGLKKPRNPATNFLKGPYAPQNSQFKHFKEKWGRSIVFFFAFIVTLTIAGVIRDDISNTMIDEAHDTLSKQAKSVAGIKGIRGFNKKLKTYIRDQKNLEKIEKLQNNVSKVNSAMDILSRIANITPTGKSSGMNIRLVDIHDETVNIEGLAKKSFDLKVYSNSLKSISSNKKVLTKKTKYPGSSTHKAFAFQIKVKRTEGAL